MGWQAGLAGELAQTYMDVSACQSVSRVRLLVGDGRVCGLYVCMYVCIWKGIDGITSYLRAAVGPPKK
jgi:hypothetical protein